MNNSMLSPDWKSLCSLVMVVIFYVPASIGQHVGIGTNNPTSNLHVQGDLKAEIILAPFEVPPLDAGYLGGSHNWYLQDDDTFVGNYAPSTENILLPSTGAQLYFIHNTPAGTYGSFSFAFKYIKVVPSVLKVSSPSITPLFLGEALEWTEVSVDLYGTGELDTIVFEYIPLEDDTLNTVLVDGLKISYITDYPLRISGGEEGAGKVLTSDPLGNASWSTLSIDRLQQNGSFAVMNANLFDVYDQDAMDLKIRSLGTDTPSLTLSNDHGEGSINWSAHQLNIFSGATITVGGFEVGVPTVRLDSNAYTGLGLGAGFPKEVLDVGGPIRLRPYYDADSTEDGTIWYQPNFDELYAKLGGEIFPIASQWRRGNGANAVAANLGVATGERSVSWGEHSTASHLYSTAWGSSSTASNHYATAWGKNNLAFGELTTTWGELNNINGTHSTGWGKDNVSTGNMATIWGEDNSTTGLKATAWGTDNTSSGLNSTAFGFDTEASGNNSLAFGLGTETNSFAEVAFGRFNNSPAGQATWWNSTDQVFSIGNGTTTSNRSNALTVLKNGNIGIGEDNPTRDLQLGSNSAAKPTSSAWEVTSDERLKTNIRSFEDGLDIVLQINPVWFTYNGKAGLPKETGVGTIAQRLEEAAPYMINEWIYVDQEGATQTYKSVDYGAMDFILINAIKELKAELGQLKSENEHLKSRLEQLEK